MPEITLKDKEMRMSGVKMKLYTITTIFSGIYLIHIPLQADIVNYPSSYFPYYNHNMRWIGLRKTGLKSPFSFV